MRKLFLFTILVFAAIACNKKYTNTDAGYGSLKVTAITDRSVISIQSRAANLDPETYILTLQSDQGIAYNGVFPTGGTISDLPAGTYIGRLKSEATEFSIPAFDSPFYAATVNNIVITSGGTTPVEFVCRQANAGVKFIYDPSLEAAGYGDIVPVVTQAENSLNYSGSNRSETGYFAAGDVTIKLLDEDTPIQISGSSTEITLSLAARELWTITLKAVVTPDNGRATIAVTIDTDVIERTLEITIGSAVTTIDPALIVFSESFELCTGRNYPIAGETFSTNTTGAYALNSQEAIDGVGLTGWTFETGYTCNKGLRMGNGTANGTATTPPLTEIGATPTTVVLTFMAANWEPDAKNIRVEVEGDGAIASPNNGIIALPAGTSSGGVISESAAMKRYNVVINGATENTKIVFAPTLGNSSRNRYFLADITVFLEE